MADQLVSPQGVWPGSGGDGASEVAAWIHDPKSQNIKGEGPQRQNLW